VLRRYPCVGVPSRKAHPEGMPEIQRDVGVAQFRSETRSMSEVFRRRIHLPLVCLKTKRETIVLRPGRRRRRIRGEQ